MLSNQARDLSRQGAEMRQEIHATKEDGSPVTLDYDNGAQTPRGYFSPVRTQEQLDEAGMHRQHDTIARIIKADFAGIPGIGKALALPMPDGSTQRVKISEFGNYTISAEWVLGCDSI